MKNLALMAAGLLAVAGCGGSEKRRAHHGDQAHEQEDERQLTPRERLAMNRENDEREYAEAEWERTHPEAGVDEDTAGRIAYVPIDAAPAVDAAPPQLPAGWFYENGQLVAPAGAHGYCAADGTCEMKPDGRACVQKKCAPVDAFACFDVIDRTSAKPAKACFATAGLCIAARAGARENYVDYKVETDCVVYRVKEKK